MDKPMLIAIVLLIICSPAYIGIVISSYVQLKEMKEKMGKIQ